MREATGQCDELATNGLGDECSREIEPECADPTHQVVHDRDQHSPGGVRVEVTRGAVFKSRTLLQVPYREFHHGVTTVVGVEGDAVAVSVGDNGVMAIGGKQRGRGVTQLRSSNNESVTTVGGLAPQASPFSA